MMGVQLQDSDFVEVDPTGRYGRYNEILGKGASKRVYRAFDEYEGIEVAWNQVKLTDFLQSPEDLERLYCEIHLLKTLKHKNIMKFYTSWVDTSNRNINFVTELFTSGTLRQYRMKHKRVHIRAVKHWCRQILRGLLYLHSRNPPIIHRDLKCDNIFINGNQGVVKIGDLGLAAILRKSHAAHCVGTPEFMAPEVYEEEYNELVDIYSFGMCLLEMVTFDYPYSECTHPAEIYKKVISGSKPEALYRIEDPEVRRFVDKCLATASQRLSARELLEDPFLRIDDRGSGSWEGDITKMCQILRQPSYELIYGNEAIIANANGFSEDCKYELRAENGWCPEEYTKTRQSSYDLLGSNGSLMTTWFHDEQTHEKHTENEWDCNAPYFEMHGINLFDNHEDEPFGIIDITIKGRRKEDGGIFLRLRIADKEGRVRNIYFPFDIESDTALGVATEMIGELDITDHDVTRIAGMIDGEVSALVPGWKLGPLTEVLPDLRSREMCHNCASNVSSTGSLLNYLSIVSTSGCHNCASHGRFEEITYQVEGSETEGGTMVSTSHSEVLELSSRSSKESHSEEYENSAIEELGALEAKSQVVQRDRRNQQMSEYRNSQPNQYFDNRESTVVNGGVSADAPPKESSSEKPMKSFQPGKHFSFRTPPRRNLLQENDSADLQSRRRRHSEANGDGSQGNMFTAQSFYSGMHRTKSLPVDGLVLNI